MTMEEMHEQRLMKLRDTTSDRSATHFRRNVEGDNALEIEADSPHDVLVGGQALVDDVCVINDVATENETSSDCHDEIKCAVEGEEHSNKASSHWTQWHEMSVKVPAKHGERCNTPNATRPPKRNGPIPEKSY